MVSELISIFLEDAPDLLNKLQICLTQQDTDGFRRIAHTLKSSSSQMGAYRLAHLSSKMEEIELADRPDTSAEILAQAVAEYEKVKAFLETKQAEFPR